MLVNSNGVVLLIVAEADGLVGSVVGVDTPFYLVAPLAALVRTDNDVTAPLLVVLEALVEKLNALHGNFLLKDLELKSEEADERNRRDVNYSYKYNN